MRKLYATVTHRSPHLDEFGVRAMLEHVQPDLASTPPIYIDATQSLSFDGEIGIVLRDLGITPKNFRGSLTADRLYDECGILIYGTGGGLLDDHAEGKAQSAAKRCAEMLLAGMLPETLAPLLRYIDNEDTRKDPNAVITRFDLGSLVRAMRATDKTDEEIFAWFSVVFETFCYPVNTTCDRAIFEQEVCAWIVDKANDGNTEVRGTIQGTLDKHGLKSPVWVELRKYFQGNERIHKDPFNLFKLYAAIWYQNGEHVTRQWLRTALDTHYEDQKRFVEICVPEYERVKDVRQVETLNGTCTVVFVHSDMYGLDRVARRRDGASVVVLFKSSGHIQVLPTVHILAELYPERVDEEGRHYMDSLVEALRLEEQLSRNVESPTTENLRSGGTLASVPCWHYHQGGQFLLNGSSSSTNVEPTAIDVATIKELVVKAFTPLSISNDAERTNHPSIEDIDSLFATL